MTTYSFDYKGAKWTIPKLAEISVASLPTLKKWLLEDGMPVEEAIQKVPKRGDPMRAATDREAWSGLEVEQQKEMREMQDLCDRTRWT